MAGRYNTWLRSALAARIRGNGGYNSRSDGGPLAWTVHYLSTHTNAERKMLMEAIISNYFVSEADMILQRPRIEEEVATLIDDPANDMWAYVQERLCDDLNDDEGLRMWSPATASRYGFDYKGEGAETGFDMDLRNYGRGGKHVCLMRFDGEQLNKHTNAELADLIDPEIEKDFNWDPQFSNGWCRKLMGIMDELDVCLTDKAAAYSGRYYEADWLARELGLFD